MTSNPILWPLDRAVEAAETFARLSGLTGSAGSPWRKGTGSERGGPLWHGHPAREIMGCRPMPRVLPQQQIAQAAAGIGLEAEPVEADYRDLDTALSRGAPAIWTASGQKPGFVVLLGGRGGTLRIVDPELRIRRVPRDAIARMIAGDRLENAEREVDLLLARGGLDSAPSGRIRGALVRERLDRTRIDGGWLLRLPPGAPFWRQLRHAGATRWLAGVVGLHALQQVLWIVAWWIVGAAALSGRADLGLLGGWALVLACIVFLRLYQGSVQARLFFMAGGLLKRRLLAGILELDAGRVREQGSGRLLGRILESAAIEQMILTGGMVTALAVLEIVSAAAVLAIGPAPGVHLATLGAWIALAALGTWRYMIGRKRWTAARLSVTGQLVERLVGHRTRLAQETPAYWHDGEDEALERYAHDSIRLDHTAVAMSGLVRTWILAGLVGMLPVLLRGEASVAALAVGIGGVLMGAQALARFNAGLGSLAGALIAGGQIRELFQAAGRRVQPGSSEAPAPIPGPGATLEAKGVRFRYEEQPAPVLHECNLRIGPGDRVLVEGASGEGKSTLAKLLNGLLEPQGGLLLLNGLDPASRGLHAWRRRIALVPAPHENHILTGSLAYNLLLGRGWPPMPGDLEAAGRVCRELGLGPLVDRMPAGLMQLVGETGWQLSQGEKSRIYLGRALLQPAEILILDESLGSLDPPTLRQCLRTLLGRPQAVVLLAHL